MRIASSRWRALARASIRFARFVQAINNTSPVIASSNCSEESYVLRSILTPVSPGYAAKRKLLKVFSAAVLYPVGAVLSKRPWLAVPRYADARLRSQPGFRRPITENRNISARG
jgi:hypothetical protein